MIQSSGIPPNFTDSPIYSPGYPCMDRTIQDHPGCGTSAAHLHLAFTREAIATITSVRRPRRVTKQRRRPSVRIEKQRRSVTVTLVGPRRFPGRQPRLIENLTNRHVALRLNSFDGEIRAHIPGCGLVKIRKAAVQQLLEEAGRTEPAIAIFNIRRGIGYLTPVAPQTRKEN
jgi:hypothetical protein